MKLLLCIWIMLCLPFSKIEAQNLDEIEKILEMNDILRTEEGYEDMVDILTELKAEPLDINTVEFDSLKMLFFLSDSQIDNILMYRKKRGTFHHLRELLLVDGIGERDWENIYPFIAIKETQASSVKNYAAWRVRQEVLVRGKMTLPFQEGYIKYERNNCKTEEEYQKKLGNRFQGIPLGTLVKYKLNAGDRLWGRMTLENDPGEGYFTCNQKMGFDFFSISLGLTFKKIVRYLLVGDYRLQWGQGLVAWGGFTTGKSGMALGNERVAKGFTSYTSSDENNYLRGVAISLQPRYNLWTDFSFSCKRTDGRMMDMDSLLESPVVSASLDQSGYHRNEQECMKKHVLAERTLGASIRWNTAYFRIGMNAIYYDFTPDITIRDEAYCRFNDNGDKRSLCSIDYKTGYKNIFLYGETAISNNGAIATVNGLRFTGSSRIALCMLYRRYDKRYTSHYAAAFGEYSNTSNEEGLYLGMALTPMKNVKINAYYDQFRFFSPRYGAFIPGAGYELLGEVTYNYLNFDGLFRIKREVKSEDFKGGAMTSRQRERNDYRCMFGYKFNRLLMMRTRIDWAHYKKAQVNDKGYMLSLDLVYAALREMFKMQFRFAYFDIDTYNARIYNYEHNVLYGYAFPVYFDRGIRTYLNLSWKFGKMATLYWKSGCVYYPDRKYLGSSLTKVEGNKLYDMTLQFRFKF